MRFAFTKAPADTLDYTVDLSKWLTDEDFIESATADLAAAADTDATVESVDYDASTFTVWVAGGADGDDFEIDCLVVTDGGREKAVCLRIKIKDC